MQTKYSNINGWLNLYKPKGITSAKAVAIVKNRLRPRKIGHAGTLDPLAEGVLPLALGEATKTIQFCMDAQKEYQFTVKWGEETSTLDSEGDITARSNVLPSAKEIKNVLPDFIGEISQTPPKFSAIKIKGERAYNLARDGVDITLSPRKISINSLDLLENSGLYASFRVSCGKGTYIRSLAHDIALKLNTLAHVTELIRNKVGDFIINNAILLEDIEKTVYKGDQTGGMLLPVDIVLDDIQVLEFTNQEATLLRYGQVVAVSDKLIQDNSILSIKANGMLVAIVQYASGFVKPLRVFNL